MLCNNKIIKFRMETENKDVCCGTFSISLNVYIPFPFLNIEFFIVRYKKRKYKYKIYQNKKSKELLTNKVLGNHELTSETLYARALTR